MDNSRTFSDAFRRRVFAVFHWSPELDHIFFVLLGIVVRLGLSKDKKARHLQDNNRIKDAD